MEMIDQSRVKAFLDALARLSDETGVGLAFGGPGNESRMRLVDRGGDELLELGELQPVLSETGLSYKLIFTGTLSFSSSLDLLPEVSYAEEAEEVVLPGRRLSRLAGSVVRVDRRFAGESSKSADSEEDQEESVASGV